MGAAADNTGWLLALLEEYRSCMTALVEANDKRYTVAHDWVQTQVDEVVLVTNRRLAGLEVKMDSHVAFEVNTALDVKGLMASLTAFKEQMATQAQLQKEAIDTALAAQKEAVASAMTAQDKAVIKAELASEKRFESVNEFRATLGDQQRMLMPRAEVEVLFRANNEKITQIQLVQTENRAAKAGAKDGWQWAVGAIGLILIVLTIVSMLRGGVH